MTTDLTTFWLFQLIFVSFTSRLHRFVVFNISVMIKGGHIKKRTIVVQHSVDALSKGNETNKLNIWIAASVHRVRQNHLNITFRRVAVSRGHYFAYENIFKGADTCISPSLCLYLQFRFFSLSTAPNSSSVSFLFCMKTDFHKIIINRF